MISDNLTPSRILLINKLVDTLSLLGPAPDRETQLNAAHLAAMRCVEWPMSEADLRAVIYDKLFPRLAHGTP